MKRVKRRREENRSQRGGEGEREELSDVPYAYLYNYGTRLTPLPALEQSVETACQRRVGEFRKLLYERNQVFSVTFCGALESELRTFGREDG